MLTKYCITLIFVLLLSITMMCKRCCKRKSKKETFVVDVPEIISNHLPAQNCCFNANNKLKTTVINVYLNRSEINQEYKEFGSVYLKCAACLAVSKQIDAVFEKIKTADDFPEPNSLKQLLKDSLQCLCSTGFKNYDLRKHDGHILVTNDFKFSEHVSSTMDYKWPMKLREMCALYIEHADVVNIYHKYINESLQLADLLCSGGGVFRDCYNLRYHPVIMPEKDEYNCKSLGICNNDCKLSQDM